MGKTARVVPAFVLAALALSCQRRESLEVAFIGSLSGKLTANSILGMNAINLYIGRPERVKARIDYNLQVFDDRSDAANLDAIVAEIRARKIRFVIGPFTSAFARKARDLLKADDVLLIAPVAAVDDLEGQDDNFIKMYPSLAGAAEGLAGRAAARGARRIVPVLDLSNQAFCDTWVGAFRKVLAGKVEVAEPVSFRNPSDVDYTRVTAAALATEADSVLLVTNSFDGSMICQMLRKARPDIALYSSSWSFNPEFLADTGRSSEGTLFTAAFDAESADPLYLGFKEEYRRLYLKEAEGFVPAYCYESVQVLDEALAAARSTAPAAVKAAIARIGTFRGLQGGFTIDGYGDGRRAYRAIVARDGAFRTLD